MYQNGDPYKPYILPLKESLELEQVAGELSGEKNGVSKIGQSERVLHEDQNNGFEVEIWTGGSVIVRDYTENGIDYVARESLWDYVEEIVDKDLKFLEK